MLNKIFIMGRLTRDPELRRTQSGTAVTSFSLAVERDFKSQGGEKETDFIDVVAWRNTAEFVAKYFTKGRMAVVEGDSKRDGAERSGDYNSYPSYSAPAGGYTAPVGGASDFSEIDEEDGDLPF